MVTGFVMTILYFLTSCVNTQRNKPEIVNGTLGYTYFCVPTQSIVVTANAPFFHI